MMRRQNLNSNRAIEPRVASAIHLAHAARAHRAYDLIRPQLRSRGKWQIPLTQWQLLYACGQVVERSAILQPQESTDVGRVGLGIGKNCQTVGEWKAHVYDNAVIKNHPGG